MIRPHKSMLKSRSFFVLGFFFLHQLQWHTFPVIICSCFSEFVKPIKKQHNHINSETSHSNSTSWMIFHFTTYPLPPKKTTQGCFELPHAGLCTFLFAVICKWITARFTITVRQEISTQVLLLWALIQFFSYLNSVSRIFYRLHKLLRELLLT